MIEMAIVVVLAAALSAAAARACHRLSQSRTAARDRTLMKLVAVFS